LEVVAKGGGTSFDAVFLMAAPFFLLEDAMIERFSSSRVKEVSGLAPAAGGLATDESYSAGENTPGEKSIPLPVPREKDAYEISE
jgi:hypothetical protein